jgi:hypothetical protein
MVLENDSGERIAINPDRFDKLITALRTAVDNDGVLDKESTSYNDVFDALDYHSSFTVLEIVVILINIRIKNEGLRYM